MDEIEIQGIGGLLAGLLGFFAFTWDWVLTKALEDVAFEILFLVVAAVGAYALREKKADAQQLSSRYVVSY